MIVTGSSGSLCIANHSGQEESVTTGRYVAMNMEE